MVAAVTQNNSALDSVLKTIQFWRSKPRFIALQLLVLFVIFTTFSFFVRYRTIHTRDEDEKMFTKEFEEKNRERDRKELSRERREIDRRGFRNNELGVKFETIGEVQRDGVWGVVANVGLVAAACATAWTFVLVKRSSASIQASMTQTVLNKLRNSNGHQQQKTNDVDVEMARESGIEREKIWNGSAWVEKKRGEQVLMNSTMTNAIEDEMNGSNSAANEFAFGFGYSEGVSEETARERAYRETRWARLEAEELEAEENEEDQRNHHDYFTQATASASTSTNDENNNDNNNNKSTTHNAKKQSGAYVGGGERKEKESATAKRERRWNRYDEKWEKLDQAHQTSRQPLTYNDIPWPPKMAKLLDRACAQPQFAAIDRRKVYHALMLQRWHPDKFMQKFGKRVRAGGDEDRIKERVDAVAKALSASV